MPRKAKKKDEYDINEVKSGQWVKPYMHGFHMKCCDCGLVHVIDFAVVDSAEEKITNGYRVMFRTYREGNEEDAI